MNVKKYSYFSILVCVVVGIVIFFSGALDSLIGKIGLVFASAYAYISIKRLKELKNQNN